MNFNEIDFNKTSNKAKDDLLKRIRNSSKKLAVFGIGSYSSEVINFLGDNNVYIDFTLDNASDKQNKKSKEFNSKINYSLNELVVMKPEDILDEKSNVLIIIISGNYAFEIKKQLIDLEFIEEDILFHLDYFWEGYSYNDEDTNKLRQVYELLEDNDSRSAFSYWIQGCVSVDSNFFIKAKSFSRNLEYVDAGLFPFGKVESFVDCGAYDGDTIKEFIDSVAGEYRHIYGIEANKGNFDLLAANTSGYSNISLYNLGVSDEKSTYYVDTFGSGDKSGFLTQDLHGKNLNKIETDSLDNLLRGKEVTYIKFDVEGFEMKALKGGGSIIKQQQPKLAISAYHLKDDIYNIPLYIKKLVPEYKIYFRHYTACYYDAIIYAI